MTLLGGPAVPPGRLHEVLGDARAVFVEPGQGVLGAGKPLLGGLAVPPGREGVPLDPAVAARWYRKAAERGLAGAQFALAGLYETAQASPRTSPRRPGGTARRPSRACEVPGCAPGPACETSRRRLRDDQGGTPLHWAVKPGLRGGRQASPRPRCRRQRGGRRRQDAAAPGGSEGPGGSSSRSFSTRCAKVNAKDEESGRPLLVVARNGHEAIVNLLLDAGADVNARTTAAKTPLHWAIKWDDEAIVALLIDQGVHVNARDHQGETLLSWAIRATSRRSSRCSSSRAPTSTPGPTTAGRRCTWPPKQAGRPSSTC